MEWFVRAFVKASVGWLAAGVTLGVAMAVHPAWTVYRLAHVHMMLLGFVTMMIYGVAYHVIPRFSGHALQGRRAATAHWWVANAGLLLMATGFVLRARGVGIATVVLGMGGTLSAASAYTFAWIAWRTIDGPRATRVPVGRDATERAAAIRDRAATSGLPLAAATRAER